MAEKALATVVDAHPRFWIELALWLVCAERSDPASRHVFLINEVPEAIADLARAHGCEVHRAETLVPGAPHCNKILPFLTLDPGLDMIVTDADVYMVEAISGLMKPGRIRAAPNNHGNPPRPVYDAVLASLGIEPSTPGLALFPNPARGSQETFESNVSAGVVMIPSELRGFASDWAARARWMRENVALLGPYGVHCDQVSFALTVDETDTPLSYLPPQANAVLQLLPVVDSVMALHLTTGHVPAFPEWFEPDGALVADRVNPKLADQLSSFNDNLRHAREIIASSPTLAPHLHKLLNPAYRRPPFDKGPA